MLFRYELKKILSNKLNLIAMFLGYVILAITVIYPVVSEGEYVSSADTSYQGLGAIRYSQNRANEQTKYLTEEYVTEVLSKLQSQKTDLNSDEGFVDAYDAFGSLYMYLVNCYKGISETEFKPQILKNIDLSNGAQFYERRMEKIDEFLNMDFSYGNYTDVEKEYWISKAKKVEEPFLWGDITVMKLYDSVLALGFYLLFVLIICIAPVFSGECEKGTDRILLASRHGKGKMIAAKILASYVFSFAYVGIGYFAALSGMYLVLGAPGMNLPVQLMDNAIPYVMTMGQFLLLQFLVSVVMVFFAVTLSLFLSAVMKSTFTTMIVMLVVLVGPAFIPFSKESRFINHVISLAAVRILDVKACLSSFIDYQIGDAVVGLVTFALVVYVVVAVFLVVFMRKVYVSRAIQD